MAYLVKFYFEMIIFKKEEYSNSFCLHLWQKEFLDKVY